MKLLGSHKSKITKDKNGENICQLLDISPKNFIFFKIFDSEWSDNDFLLTDQNSNAPEIGDKINTILVINWSMTYKKQHAIQFNQEAG